MRQVADYQAHLEEFEAEDADIVALSVDPLDKAKEMVAKTGAKFPIGYGLKVPQDADKVGAYWEERRGIIHATNFTLDANRRVLQACFATGPPRPNRCRRCAELDQGNKKKKSPGRMSPIYEIEISVRSAAIRAASQAGSQNLNDLIRSYFFTPKISSKSFIAGFKSLLSGSSVSK